MRTGAALWRPVTTAEAGINLAGHLSKSVSAAGLTHTAAGLFHRCVIIDQRKRVIPAQLTGFVMMQIRR